MTKFEGYQKIKEIHKGRRHLVYRAVSEDSNQAVIIKLLRAAFPSSEQLRNFASEFELLEALKEEDIAPYPLAKFDFQNTKAFVMRDDGFQVLREFMAGHSFSQKEYLIFMINITSALAILNKRNIIHKDINPANILINPENLKVKLIDFGLASTLSKEHQTIVSPGQLEGTLAYISPEQTGRMNRSIDYRTDLYSLGVTFYEIVAGKLPFESNDPMELVHSHIAKKSIPPHEINDTIPQVLSEIIMKLLEKTAEQRYQGSEGLLWDLNHCKKSLSKEDQIPFFEIGHHDHSAKFQIPEKIYGRDEEITGLLNIFERVATEGSKAIVFVSGESGIGKTVLVNEVHKPISEKHGYFISGKFDEFKREIPYSAIIQAFQDLVKQIITESDDQIAKWKDAVLQAVGQNGQVITKLIPEFELLIGEQPEVSDLPTENVQNLFRLIFQNFIKVFSGKNHPLVLFIDDLQWIDLASLSLLKVLFFDPGLQHFLFIGAYRDNQVDGGHPLLGVLDDFKNNEIPSSEIKLQPLKINDIKALLADIFEGYGKEYDELAEIIHKKSGGIPFFTLEYLRLLHKRGIIDFNESWKYDDTRLNQAGVTENMIELMSLKVRNLHENTLDLLKVACCIGISFELNVLVLVSNRSISECLDCLQEFIEKGLVVKIANKFRFIHDKIREAIYAVISDEEKKKLHYQIGSILLNDDDFKNAENSLFTILNLLNSTLDLLNEDEKREIIQLNIKAGESAKRASAFEASVAYYRSAEKLLQPNSWENEYNQTFSLYSKLAEAEYLSTNYAEAIRISNSILDKTNNVLHRIVTYQVLINCYTGENNAEMGISSGMKAAMELGVEIPENPDFDLVVAEAKEVLKVLGKKSRSELINHRISNDKELDALGKLFYSMVALVYMHRPVLSPYLAITIIKLSLKHGLIETTPYALSMFAIFCNNSFEEWEKSLNIASAAKEISNKFQNKALVSFCSFIHTCFLHTFKSPNDIIKNYHDALSIALDAGDIQYASYDIFYIIALRLANGEELSNLKDVLEKHQPTLSRLHQKVTNLYISIYQQFSENIKNNPDSITRLCGQYFDEEAIFNDKQLASDINLTFHYSFPKLLLNYLFDRSKDSLHLIKKIEDNIPTFSSQSYSTCERLLMALTYADVCEESDEKTKKDLIDKIDAMVKFFNKLVLINYPLHHNKRDLIAAELSRLTGKPLSVVLGLDENKNEIHKEISTMELYEMAIKGAHKNGFTQEEAIANECAAKFYLTQGARTAAAAHMVQARYCYEKWGCHPKVELLDKQYPDLLVSVMLSEPSISPISGTITVTKGEIDSAGSSSKAGTVLDLGTVMKSSYVLSGEMDMSVLLEKMIHILVENAGAQRGVLLIPGKNNGLKVEAEWDVESKNAIVLQSIKISEADNLSPSVVRYVAKTKEPIVLDNASKDITYGNDSYIKRKKPLSVLCSPIVYKKRLVAVLYLENNLSIGAFTTQRVNILNLLSTQAAISIENARTIEENNRLFQEQKKDKEQLAESLKEKETLIGELFHRTKNNMQMLSSLLKLQSMYTNSSETQDALEEASGKLEAMILVQNQLYQSQDLSELSIKIYIQNLAIMIKENFGKYGIELDMDIDDIVLLFDIATPLGLVISELVTNAFKYAFPDEKGKISIILKHRPDDTIELTVKDNGVGFGDKIDLSNPKSLGLTLVVSIVRDQLDGILEANSDNGAEFKIVIRKDIYNKRV